MTNHQLKAHCEDVIANPQDHSKMVLAMARALLPCLEAKPVAYADAKAIMRMLDGGTRFFTAFPGTSKTKSIPVFIDVPVPELKPIELVKYLPDNSKESQDYRVGFAMGCAKYAEGMVKNILAAGYEVKP